jgi:hypothetical protein
MTFLLSSSHMVLTLQSVNIAYFTQNSAHRGQGNAQGDHIAIILQLTNVSSEYNVLLLIYCLAVFCSRYHCAVASLGVVGENLAISCRPVSSLAVKCR